ncbi:uncharacterized protein LOC123411156 [Hordeum vulgare subsp. vulgare]|uniref:Predicted protein n=1 Tax=Hordeum vulgare subsp. vulgare TaxID=112509 RepID=F2DV77_HORVV|nr:uncharacterized protein LOC123411156 [Hordeum vulgare subsp. vulgare]BAJ98998.1 predicted protein [Hordeum vulgare subsp. vulgare]
MARELSKKNLELVLMQAMMAAKNVRTQRDRLLELHRRLHRHQHQADTDADAEAELGQIASDVFKVYYLGLDPGARMLWVCLDTAVKNRAVSAVNMAFALLPDERLYDALLAQKLPARPTTQPQAIARVESAVLAVKMLEEHHLPRCVECLVGGHAPVPGKPRDLAKADLSDDPDATATKPRHVASGQDVDKALDYLCRANRITTLAIKHIDLAVAVLSRFLDPKELARLADLTDRAAYLGVEISQPTTSSPDPSSSPATWD